ncbi:MAG TPA: TolC family protein [Gallionellaceae bacterium]|nr:TolC family protein [Gallionellaceae bacterium]
MKRLLILLASLSPALPMAAEGEFADLPPPPQVEAALRQHINVQTATTDILLEQSNQRKLESGSYEFNLRAGGAQRNISSTGQVLREWDVALERPLRLFNKGSLDSDIGAEGVSRAEFALGDARHEASRLLLHLWFNWQREQTQVGQWQQQVDILDQQAQMTEKRLRAGDAPRMELNLAQAALAQARVSLQQASMRAQLAASELQRPFPELPLPTQSVLATPQPIEHELSYWQEKIMADNHELRMMQSDSRIQQLLAERSSADRVPDPTIGLRYSNEKEGEEKVSGVYVSIPLSFGLRGTQAQIARRHAEIAHQREAATQRRVEGDVYASYTQATNSYLIWQQAEQAAGSVRQNADLVARAYALGESSLTDTLNARRLALESSLAASMAQLDANESRYRLLLDAHQLWPLDVHDGETSP